MLRGQLNNRGGRKKKYVPGKEYSGRKGFVLCLAQNFHARITRTGLPRTGPSDRLGSSVGPVIECLACQMTTIEICSFAIYFPGLHNIHAMFSFKWKIKVGSGKQAKLFCKKGPIKFGSQQNYAKLGSNFWILRIVVSLSLLCHPSPHTAVNCASSTERKLPVAARLQQKQVLAQFLFPNPNSPFSQSLPAESAKRDTRAPGGNCVGQDTVFVNFSHVNHFNCSPINQPRTTLNLATAAPPPFRPTLPSTLLPPSRPSTFHRRLCSRRLPLHPNRHRRQRTR